MYLGIRRIRASIVPSISDLIIPEMRGDRIRAIIVLKGLIMFAKNVACHIFTAGSLQWTVPSSSNCLPRRIERGTKLVGRPIIRNHGRRWLLSIAFQCRWPHRLSFWAIGIRILRRLAKEP